MDKESFFNRCLLNQKVFYVAQLIANAFLLSFYAVLVFAPHEACIGPGNGYNITRTFVIMFNVGFVWHLLDLLNSGVFELYLRQRMVGDLNERGLVMTNTYRFQCVYLCIEWSLRAFGVLVCGV